MATELGPMLLGPLRCSLNKGATRSRLAIRCLRVDRSRPCRHQSTSSRAEGSSSPSPTPPFSREVPSWHRVVAYLAWLPVAAYFSSHIYSIGQVKGGSMAPTLNPDFDTNPLLQDIVLLNRWAAMPRYQVWPSSDDDNDDDNYDDHDDGHSDGGKTKLAAAESRARSKSHLQVGDVVVLTSPLDPNVKLTKRIIALGGDYVVFSGGEPRKKKRVKVPPNHAWIEGDYRPSAITATMTKMGREEDERRRRSQDSATFGPVPLGLVRARVDFILWPLARIGFVPPPPPPPPPPPSQPLAASLGAQKRDDDAAVVWRRSEENMKRLDDDSPLSPYRSGGATTWSSSKNDQGNLAHEEGTDDNEGEALPLSRAALLRQRSRQRKREDQRQQWNSMSRGGSLGDNAAGEQVEQDEIKR
ncbi:LexA/Signal peptidase [Acaromyces ingoldii]|uniref:Mitochondrial inner membrane protease subunit 2 n=1 Tax=Acaromyces ingoldii TaxID=215250 RepID=A0A316YLP7_9BASI|nr:LexA/Signal peptidase [Acaromyces ingoldii]PWN88645.1 LexA/Signal peptidase [Acaromyces ingoldii]